MSDAAHDQHKAWRAWRMDDLAHAANAPDADAAAPAAGRTGESASDALEADLRDLRQEARAAARDEGYAAGLVDGQAAGYAAGLEQGRKAGDAEFDAQRAGLLAPLVALADGLREALDQVDAEIGDALVDVALAVGHKLAGDALDAHPEQVRALIAELLREEPLFTGPPCLRLNPADHALVGTELAEQLAAANWRLQDDASIARGGCRVTGPEGELNATRETRWLALLARVRRRGSAPIDHGATSDPAAAPE